MWWFWALFIIVGSILAFVCCNPNDGSTPSKNTTPTKKEKSIDSLLAELEQINRANQIKNNAKNASNNPRANSGSTVDYMPVDPTKYVFEGPLNKLTKYISDANEDTLCIPMGTRFVGDGEHSIRNRPWDIVYIPRSVIKIDDCALPFVESVYYEGSAEEFAKINKGDLPGSNFTTGFIPNYAKNTPYEEFSKVKEVKYSYNTNITQMYKMLAEERAKKASCNANIITNAQAFVSMCQKLDRLSGSPRNYYSVIKKDSSSGTAEFYITHTFHDVDWLEFACASMRKGETHMVKHYYDLLTGEKVQLTEKEKGFFLNYYSDFCDFLNGGIEGWNICKFNGLSDVTIEQKVGSCSQKEIVETHKELLTLTNKVF